MLKRVKSNITLLNSISNVTMQVATLLSGFIIPKIILSYFGSEVNGLISSLMQFLSYISLLEGGVTGVVMANLYKPLAEKNEEKASAIVSAANSFYKSISVIFIIYSIILAIVYPIIFKTNFSYVFIFTLTIVLSLNTFIQYCFSLTLKTFLNADKKVYIVSFSQTVIIFINILLAFISIKVFPNVHFLKIVTSVTYLIQPLIYNNYVKKHYNINIKAAKDKNVLKSRWDGFAINIAAFIHFSTDIVILTIFTDFQTVSVYSVYSLITNGLRSIVLAISSSISPTIGHIYARNDNKEINKKFDLYEYIIFMIVFILFVVGGILINPFVLIYVRNINDTNYNQPIFGILLIISEMMYLIKSPHSNLAYSANKFKELKNQCYVEAVINIVVSLLLVRKCGLIGVAIGTLVAMGYRMIAQVIFACKIIKRPVTKFYKKVILFTIFTIIGLFMCNYLIPDVNNSIINWILHGIIYTIIFTIIYYIMSKIFYKEELNYYKKTFLK